MTSSICNVVRRLILISTFSVIVVGFNLEPRVPLIKQGTNGSYFGYSVAQHILSYSHDPYTFHNSSRLVVGAPKYEGGGAVFYCNVTSRRDDCKIVEIDAGGGGPLPDEVKSDQWLGVTVRSQGFDGFVVACAHRYVINTTSAHWGFGMCYSFGKFLDFLDEFSPCKGRSVSKAHEEFGYCQAGTSIAIAKDNTSVFGAPGPYTWRGTVFSTSISGNMHDDRGWYLGPLDAISSPVDKYSYLGMSVTSGVFFNNTLSYVGGAPRSNGTGEVVFFKKIPATPTFQVQLILSGDTFASSFGYELCSINVNGDDFLDLVVGAPFYYARDHGGAIYIYENSPNFIKGNTQPKIIKGKSDSRFGFALTNLKDINKDGYEDLAVGAPYESHGVVYIYLGSADGLGSKPSQVIKSEEFPGESIVTFGYSLSGGMDLDGNGYPDLLVGAYEADRVILLRSRPIIEFKTKVEGKLKDIDSNKRNCSEDPFVSFPCFNIRHCFKLISSTSTPGTLNLNYSLVAEVFGGKQYSRVSFQRSRNQKYPYRIDRSLIIGSNAWDSFQCQNELVYVNDTKYKKDILNPIRFMLTYSLVQEPPKPEREGEPLLDINQYPILDQQEAISYFEATFAKKCGNDEICVSDLRVNASLNLENGEMVLEMGKEVVLSITVVNENESAYDAGLYVTSPASLKYIAGSSLGDSIFCDLEKTHIYCHLGNPFNYKARSDVTLRFSPSGVKDTEQKMTFVIKANSTSEEVHPKKDTVIEAKIKRKVELGISGSGTEEQVFYGGDIIGESAIKYEDQVGSNVTHVYQVTNDGPWKLDNVMVVVHWPYEVENRKKHGKWLLYLMERPIVDQHDGICEIDPSRINPLRLTSTNLSYNQEVNVQSDAPAAYRNKESEDDIPKFRSKRQTSNGSEKPLAEYRAENVVVMECNNTAKCFSFRCFIRNFEANDKAVIKIRARLWNHTFVEDYPNVDMVVIKSRAAIELDPKVIIEQNIANDVAYAETKAYPDIQVAQTIKEVPIWIIIVAVCAGILLLIIIILVLWKLGFFRREKHEAMMKGDLHKQPNDINNVDH